ncbi:MAG TPA: panthothenate synthetase [Phycisphaerae bacterium]|nr:panthothenate synthetase [Phycisphaerae bacterium]
MKILLNVKFPHARFNAAVKDGSAGTKMNRILEELKPEAVYFMDQEGLRSAVIIVDLPSPSAIPALAEPFFLLFDATVELKVVMTPEDLKKAGLEALGKKWA